MKSIGILLFDDVELLDFAGPLEVFTSANHVSDNGLFSVETIGLTERIRVSKSNLDIRPDKVFNESLSYDLFLIPGGIGTRAMIKDRDLLKRLDVVINNSARTATVCTGSLILAKLGHLKDQKATSHHLALHILQAQDETIDIQKDKRYIDLGKYITSAGVSAGIDMSLYLVEQAFGQNTREQAARYMEYIGTQ